MEYLSSILSWIFFTAFCIYIFWGTYIIRSNPKGALNKVFFAFIISACIWSFGYSMIFLTLDGERALFWMRFSSAGKMLLFATVLHFMLLVANKDASSKQKNLFILIYIPALMNIYIFALSNVMASIQHNMIRTNYGWVSSPANNIWSFLYYLYFSVYLISSLIIVWRWKKKINRKATIKQANFFYITFIGAFIMGTFTDIVASSIFENPLPQMTPLFILLPTRAMYYSARHYGIIDTEKKDKEEIIVTQEDRKKIFSNASIAFYIVAFLVFIYEYRPYLSEEDSLKTALFKGLPFIAIGLVIRLIQNIKKETLKENLTIGVLISTIPFGILQYLNEGGLTVWAFPLVIIISSTIFSKITLLVLSSIVAIVTQMLIWIIYPEITVVIDKYHYIFRIGMFFVAFLIGLYINKIYVAKIKENKYQIEFQKMVSDVSYKFLSLRQDNFEDKVNNLLESIGSFFHVDRTYLFTINHHNNTMTYSNEWCNAGIGQEVGTIDEISLDVFPWWLDQLKRKSLVYISDVDDMPEEASAEQAQLHRQEVKSLVSVPVTGEGKIQGFIGIDSVLETKEWSDKKIEMLNIMANILSSGMIQIKSDKEVEFMAYYDNLTKLPNRFLFADRVNQAIHLCKRTGKYIGVIFIDLDDFKTVNDTIGHMGGDLLLQQVAKDLGQVVRETDTVARFGGDEFMIMVNNISDYDEITKVLDKIMKIFSGEFHINGQEFLITASAGIARYPVDGVDSETLVKNADIAMYKAKSKGKNQYALCTKEMKDEIQINTDLCKDLYQALGNDEFKIYYQPQVDLSTNKITGAEALLRWIHPTRGMISPSIFIPIAEKNNLINSIGQWVLKTACLQNKKWQDMGLPPVNMAVNLSTVEITNPKISENIENIIKETGLDPKYIELEITESIAIKEADYVLNILNKLKKVGVSIAIDDFGTEYSSLGRLKLLPIDRIKIDLQFVQGIEKDEKDKAIIMVIINLAKTLGLNVLAEGVETAGQLEFLKEKKCDGVQGYYYYKPMPADEMEKILLDLSRIEEGITSKSLKLNPNLKPIKQY